MEESNLRPEYHNISWKLRALARMVNDEFGNENLTGARMNKRMSGNSSPLFERGRFYELYSARRNERLKRKKKKGRQGKRRILHMVLGSQLSHQRKEIQRSWKT